MAREEASSSGAQTVFIYAICIFLIYLILACLYESFLVPFAVIFSVPFGLMGSFLFAKIFGLENNIYLQTGVIMLIGLLAKTAILITEYAIERRRKGMGIVESAYSYRNYKQQRQCSDSHTANDTRTQRTVSVGTCTAGEHQRQHTENHRQRQV